MSTLQKVFSYFMGQAAYQFVIGRLKKKALLLYLKTLQATRRSLILALLVYGVLQLMFFGFIGFIVTAIWLLPEDTETKLFVLLGFFGFLLFVPLIALFYFMSEKTWFHLSGVEQILKES